MFVLSEPSSTPCNHTWQAKPSSATQALPAEAVCCNPIGVKGWLRSRRSHGLWDHKLESPPWILVFAFCCGTPLVFQRRDPQVKSTISPACCSEHQGQPGLGGGGKTWSARSCLPPGGCVVSVCTCISAKQCGISILSPLSPEKLIPEPVHTLCSIILVILSCPQHALVRSKIVLGHP